MNKRLLEGHCIGIIGGCGHVGLPLGVKLSLAGADVRLVDIDVEAVEMVNRGEFPFIENHGNEQLRRAIDLGLRAVTDDSQCLDANVLVFVTGTPVDEHLNPKLSDVLKVFKSYKQYFSSEKLIIMRSTLFPGTMEHLYERLTNDFPGIKLAFCPERVSQGHGLDEIETIPQIVSAYDDKSFKSASEIFTAIAPQVVKLSPLEAELAKLMANSWRYLEFSIANQFYMIADSCGVDFHRVFKAIKHQYPRANGYKSPGFAAGPCLFKDTMQLASFFDNQFYLGHAAMLVNEGLASFVIDKLKKKIGARLWGRTIGLLGMAFKANNDDIRESLSFKVKKLLEFQGVTVLCADPYVPGSDDLDDVLEQSEALVLCTPHDEYKSLSPTVTCIDIWGLLYPSDIDVLPAGR